MNISSNNVGNDIQNVEYSKINMSNRYTVKFDMDVAPSAASLKTIDIDELSFTIYENNDYISPILYDVFKQLNIQNYYASILSDKNGFYFQTDDKDLYNKIINQTITAKCTTVKIIPYNEDIEYRTVYDG